MFPQAAGYDKSMTMFSPDGRLYQVEYAMETVRRGSLALGIKTNQGTLLAAEEKINKLQTSGLTQKIFQVDNHIGVAAAGYIPDARILVDHARMASQSNRLVYDQPVDVETLARKIADLLQQFTQFGGVRPFGVSLIFCGVDRTGSHIWKTDPSGNYVAFNAIAIGSGSEKVIELLEKQYKEDISFDNAAILALESIFTSSDQPTNIENIKMSIIDSETHTMKNLSDDELANYAKKVNTGKRKPEN
jgi:proteasome alpha subunit